MRFCLLTTFFPPEHFGGDAIFVNNLANALCGAGHEVEVVHCSDSFQMLRGSIQPSNVWLDPRVVVHSLRSSFGAVSPFLTHGTGRPMVKGPALQKILSRGFDVVHWHNLSLVGGPGALAYAEGVRLYTLHDYWLICPTHILFKNNEEACTQPQCLRCTLKHRRLPQMWRSGSYLPEALRNVDSFLTPSRFVQRRFKESALQIDATVLPHFFNPQPKAMRDSERGDYYLFVGRLEKAKGLQTILPLFQGKGRKLLVAGTGTYEAQLRAEASRYPQVEFVGRVPHDKLAGLYTGAIATLVPSLCFETFGLTILESLAQGTPVITSQYGALPEVIADTGGGETYSTTQELSEILDRFDASPAHRERLAKTGQASLKRYSVDAHLAHYFEIIEKARSGKGKRQAESILV